MCGRGRYSLLSANRINAYAREHGGARQSGRNDNASTEGASRLQPANQGGAHFEQHQAPEILNNYIENLSPGMRIPVLCSSAKDISPIQIMTWGLIPKYTKYVSRSDHYKLFNKRIETLGSGYFRNLAAAKRCVVVLDGFYEWKDEGGKKVPYYVNTGGSPLLMAGIYESVQIPAENGENQEILTFAIITCEPSATFSVLHNRQPVLLDDTQAEEWLKEDVGDVGVLLSQFETNAKNPACPINSLVKFHQVSSKMTNAKYQEPDCTKPVAKAEISQFFGKKEEGKGSKQAKALEDSEVICIDVDAASDAAPVSAKRDREGEEQDVICIDTKEPAQSPGNKRKEAATPSSESRKKSKTAVSSPSKQVKLTNFFSSALK